MSNTCEAFSFKLNMFIAPRINKITVSLRINNNQDMVVKMKIIELQRGVLL